MTAVSPTPKRLLLIPIGLYLVLSFAYLFAIPVGESPDEPGHLQCIEQVSQHHRLPTVDPAPEGRWWSRGVILSGQLCYHMPLYYLVGGYVQRGIAAVTQEPLHFEFPPNKPRQLQTDAMFLHEEKTTFWQLPEPFTLVGLRLLSIALGGVTIWASYVVARRLFAVQEDAALLAAVMAAGWPQFVYMSRAINNDALATALAAMVLIILLQIGRPNRFVGAALLAVLAVLTKLSVIFVVGAVLGTWIVEFVMLRQQRKRYVHVLWWMLVIWGLAGALIRFQPVLYEHFIYGSGQVATISPKVFTAVYWRDVVLMTLSSGWARFGWMNIPAPAIHAYVWWIGVLAMMIVGFVAAWRSQVTRQGRLALFVLGLWGVGIIISYLRINLNRFQPQFRYMMTILPVITTLSAAGWLALLRKFVRSRIIVILFVLLLLAYNYWLIMAIVGPAYGWRL